MKNLIEEAVEGKKVYDLIVEGDQAIEAAAATVYNKKTAKGAVPKGQCMHIQPYDDSLAIIFRQVLPFQHAYPSIMRLHTSHP